MGSSISQQRQQAEEVSNSHLLLSCFDLLFVPRVLPDSELEPSFDSENPTVPVMEFYDSKAEDFIYGSVLQAGAFGLVVEVMKKTSKRRFAMKIQSKSVACAALGDNAWRACMEPRASALFSHPYLQELFLAFQTETLLILVMSIGTGSNLETVMKIDGNLKHAHIVHYAAEMTSALCYLHSLKLIYRNLRPSTVLVNEDGHIQLSDFSSVADMDQALKNKCASNAMIDAPLPSNTDRLLRLGKSFSASLKTLSTSVPSSQYRYCKKTIESTMTSHSYMAPELAAMFRSNSQQQGNSTRALSGSAQDWWGVGVLVYSMLKCAYPPSCNNADVDTSSHFDAIVSRMEESVGSEMAERTAGFIGELIVVNPLLRLGTYAETDVLEHAIFDGIQWNELENKSITPPQLPSGVVVVDANRQEAHQQQELLGFKSIDDLLSTHGKDRWLRCNTSLEVAQKWFTSWHYTSLSYDQC